MATSSGRTSFKQDMPPPGGYSPFNWAKVPGRKRLSGYTSFGIFFGVSALAWAGYYYERRIKHWQKIEMNDGRLALEPLIVAEEQRMYLKHLRATRDEENELMKDVPGWVTGTLYGDPVYYNLNDRFPVIHPEAYFAQNKWKDMYDRLYDRRWH